MEPARAPRVKRPPLFLFVFFLFMTRAAPPSHAHRVLGGRNGALPGARVRSPSSPICCVVVLRRATTRRGVNAPGAIKLTHATPLSSLRSAWSGEAAVSGASGNTLLVLIWVPRLRQTTPLFIFRAPGRRPRSKPHNTNMEVESLGTSGDSNITHYTTVTHPSSISECRLAGYVTGHRHYRGCACCFLSPHV
ncbi:hypothetical protein NDU88_001130 [Pleurodeles waltl]|uniref:Secreted protein n=1 Tax=Pleurodeles waltl TaxID=8319 RepID=A0AAV7URY1_PLEWA|nr:hypothetical protein NDU88_001130 [Pleurodeles waltl]